MAGFKRHHDKGLTLIEVMISMLVILIVVIGAVSYMYATAKDAKEADVRATAARIGLLLMEGWKANGVDVTIFNPVTDFNKLPLSDFGNPGSLGTLPGLTNLLTTTTNSNGYRIEANKVKYFVKMTYDNNTPRTLSVCVAWNRDYSSTTLGTNKNYVVLSDYAIY